MSRIIRPIVTTLVAVWAALFVPFACSPSNETASRKATDRKIERPNILIWLLDTLRADHLSLYGYTRSTTPNIDALARDSVVFENAYAPSSWTKPSTASLLTGRYPTVHGAVGYHGRLADVKTMGAYLAALGYETVAFSANPWIAPQWGFDAGFDRFNPSRRKLYGATSWQIAREVLKLVDGADRARPFFCYVHVLDPHDAYMPPEPFDTMWGDRLPHRAMVGRGLVDPSDAVIKDLKKGYDGEIRFADEQLGRVIARAKQRGLYDDMLIVVTSDHGEAFFEHGRGGHGHSLYETLVRVPLVIKLPNHMHAGKRIDRRASLLDVLPTVLGYLDSPVVLDGENLLPWLDGPSDGRSDRVLFFQTDHTDSATQPAERRILSAVLAGQFKYVRSIAPKATPQLFHLADDPNEHNNVIDQHPQLARTLSQLLDDYSRQAEPGIQLRFVNREIKNSHPITLSAVLRTDGRFADVATRACENGDSVQLSADGRTLRVTFQGINSRAEGSAGELRHLDWWIVDQDRLVFHVMPSSARITVESLTVDGEAFPLTVGAGDTVELLPWMIEANSSKLVGNEIHQPAAVDRGFSNTTPPGVDLFSVPQTGTTETQQLDPELARQLESLGYVSGE